VLLDFLEDDGFFMGDDKRIKSKTEIVKRKRQESDESAVGGGQGGQGDTEQVINGE
jgi:hypothetical protein